MNFFGTSSDDGFADLIEPRELQAASTTAVSFGGLLAAPIQLHQDLAKGCGGQIWRAGELLTSYILRSKILLAGKRIVELGAGGGMTSLAVAVACDLEGSELWCTDMHAMLDLIRVNVGLNGVGETVRVQLLDWADPVPEVVGGREVDVIFAADCVYYEPAFPLLLKTLIALIGENTVCYFCFKKRRKADLHFIKSAKKQFNMVEVNFMNDPGYKAFARENLFLYVVTKKKMRV